MRLSSILAVAVSCGAVACQADSFSSGDAGDSGVTADVATTDGPSGEATIDSGPTCKWCPFSSPQGATDLLAVWAGTKNVWVGGKGGYLAQWNGAQWSVASPASGADIIDLAGGDAAVYFLTSAGDVFELSGSWTKVETFNQAIAIAVDPSGGLWVATPNTVYGNVLGNKVTFSVPITVHDLAVNGVDFFAVGGPGALPDNVHIAQYATANALDENVGQSGDVLYAVSATSTAVVAAGVNGLVGTAAAPFQTWSTAIVGSHDWFGAAAGPAGGLAVVGDNGLIAAGDTSGLAPQPSPTTNPLRAVAAVPKFQGTEVWAVGDKGTIVHGTL